MLNVGTGKTTLVRFIIEALDVEEEKVAYATYTGKAAQVLVKKGNKNAMTLHKLLYDFSPQKDGTFSRQPKPCLNYEVVCIDEVSMVPKDMLELLFSHDVYVLCCGDPFQLPSLFSNSEHNLLDSPHVFLDEIMRQAKESEIIRLSMAIRENKSLTPCKGKEVMILPHNALSTGMMTWADQIICSKNKTRIKLNQKMRELLGRGENPEDGDKIICLRNYWNIISDDENPLVNGTIGTLKNSRKSMFICSMNGHRFTRPIILGGLCSDGVGEFYNLHMDNQCILTGEYSLSPKEVYTIRSSRYKKTMPLEVTYGYAITTWKAEGSEFDNVLVIEEDFPFDKETHRKALYTSITRSSKKLVLITKE